MRTEDKVPTSVLVSVVDDDESIRDSAKALLRSVGYQVAAFESGEQFLESGLVSETRCLILDLRMPRMDGLELQRRLKISQAPVPIIFVTAHSNKTNRQLAIDGGAADFLPKPFAAVDFLAAIEAALKSQRNPDDDPSENA
jgi:FixJ family two-component response regulator